MTTTAKHNGKTTWHERFYLYRQTDVTGVSGTGVIAEGVRFEDGVCVMRWCVPDKPRGTTVYESIVDVMSIHGHDGATTVMWLDTTDEVPVDVTACEGPPCDHNDTLKVNICQVDETVGEGPEQPEDSHSLTDGARLPTGDVVRGKAKANLGALVS